MRDYRIDFLRGIAWLMIFINHVQGDPFSSFMLHAFVILDIGFRDACTPVWRPPDSLRSQGASARRTAHV